MLYCYMIYLLLKYLYFAIKCSIKNNIHNAVNSHNCLIIDEKLHSLFIFFNGRQYAVSIRKISSP